MQNVQNLSSMNKDVPEFLKKNKAFLQRFEQEMKDLESIRLIKEQFEMCKNKHQQLMIKFILPELLKKINL